VPAELGSDRLIFPSIDQAAGGGGAFLGWGCCSWSGSRGRACSGAGAAAWTPPPRTPSSPGTSTAAPAAPTSSTTCMFSAASYLALLALAATVAFPWRKWAGGRWPVGKETAFAHVEAAPRFLIGPGEFVRPARCDLNSAGSAAALQIGCRFQVNLRWN
jgi:hypothetical protein